MFVGMARIELFIPSSSSLKDKRRVIRSTIDLVRKHNNVAVAEIAHQDLWQRSCLGMTCVAGSAGGCDKVMQQVEKTVARAIVGTAEIVHRERVSVAMEDLV